MSGVDLCHHGKVIRREPGNRSCVDRDPSKRRSRVNPDAIQRDEWPRDWKCRGTRRPSHAAIEHVRGRPSWEPVIEVAKHDNRRIANGIEIVQDLPHLKSAFVNAQAEMCREHVQGRAAGIDRRRQRATRLAALHRQIDAMHFHDGMARKQRVAEAFRHGLPRPVSCRAQRALIAIERREDDGRARFQCDAGWVRELLQRDDVRVQLPNHGRHAIRIVTSVSPHTCVHVVGRDPERRGAATSRTPLGRDGWRPPGQTDESGETLAAPMPTRTAARLRQWW